MSARKRVLSKSRTALWKPLQAAFPERMMLCCVHLLRGDARAARAPAALGAAQPQAVTFPLLITVREIRSRCFKTSGSLKMSFPNLIIFLLLQHMLWRR